MVRPRNRKSNLPPYRWLYNILVGFCRKYRKPITLTFEEFLSFTAVTECHYCGGFILWPKWTTRRSKDGKLIKHRRAYYLDRKDNEQGYAKENCVVCCSWCNSIKGNDLSYAEMLLLREALQIIRHLRNGSTATSQCQTYPETFGVVPKICAQ